MNQTLHSHQVIHAFAHKVDAKDCRKRPHGNGSIRPGGRNLISRHLVYARGIVTRVIMFLPLVVAEFLAGDVASDGWFGGVLNQTSQLLALASLF